MSKHLVGRQLAFAYGEKLVLDGVSAIVAPGV